MTHFMRLLKGFFLIIFLLLPTLTLATISAKVPASMQSKKVQLLFVLLSKKGAIHAIKGQSGYYKLTLTGVDPAVIYFTNRPQRYSGKIELAKLINRWKISTFKTSPPNAVIEAVRLIEHNAATHKRSVSYTVVLKNPQYDPRKAILTFQIRALPGSGGNKLPDVAHSDYVALFIDSLTDVCPGCMG